MSPAVLVLVMSLCVCVTNQRPMATTLCVYEDEGQSAQKYRFDKVHFHFKQK